MSMVNFLEIGAKESKYNATHWFRYLRKIIKNDQIIISEKEIKELIKSNKLTMFQKVTLERTCTINSPTYKYINSLNKPAKKKIINLLLKGVKNE